MLLEFFYGDAEVLVWWVLRETLYFLAQAAGSLLDSLQRSDHRGVFLVGGAAERVVVGVEDRPAPLLLEDAAVGDEGGEDGGKVSFFEGVFEVQKDFLGGEGAVARLRRVRMLDLASGGAAVLMVILAFCRGCLVSGLDVSAD